MPVHDGTGVLRKVLLCPPTYYELVPVDDFARTALERGDKVDHDKAQAQHNELADILRDAGVETCYIEDPDPTRHYAVNARDFAVNTPDGVVICRFKYSERRGEEAPGEKQLRKLGYRIFSRIERGCWEGGDNKYIDEKNLATGTGERSTWPGIQNAQEIFAKQGIKVHGIPIPPKWTHLDCVFAPVAHKLALIVKSEVPDWFVGFLEGREYELVDVPVEKAQGQVALNVLCLGNDRVLSFKDNAYVNEILKSLGLTICEPVLTEFTERGQGPHCLTFELERD
ncbi:MAG: dimethylarginine dimethylaminohydrolase family protein [Acidobacteriota bacterium]